MKFKVWCSTVLLLLMSCLGCWTVAAYGDGPFCGSFVDALGRSGLVSEGNGGGRNAAFLLASYELMRFDITWLDEDTERLRPATGDVANLYISKNDSPERKYSLDLCSLDLDVGAFRIRSDFDGVYSVIGEVGHACTFPDGPWRHGMDVYIENESSLYAFISYYEQLIRNGVWRSFDEVEAQLRDDFGSGSYIEYDMPTYAVRLDDIDGWRCTECSVLECRVGGCAVSCYTNVSWPVEVTYTLSPYVTYTDGVPDEEVFEDQLTSTTESGVDLFLHDDTPAFVSNTRSSTPVRDGYNFVGWKLVTGPDKDTDTPGGVRPTIEASQMNDHEPWVIYEAVWKEISDSEPPKLAITKTASKQTVAPGDEVIYTITVSNIGESTATNVTVEDILDSRLVFQSFKLGDSGVVDTIQPVDGVYNIGDLPAGAYEKLYITVRVADGTPDCTIKNKAVATRS